MDSLNPPSILISNTLYDGQIFASSLSSAKSKLRSLRWKIRWHVFDHDKPQKWITILVIGKSVEVLLLFQSASFCITICRCLTFPTARNSVDFMASIIQITLLFSNVRSDKKNHLAITAEMQLIPDF
ncbi:hypothetical protein T4D_1254 [Trichinella pseudospiralis]|uniref:Uncharacterized protein n=1 Tax=Trichinella pseudospiralis TaxID=6337 RepID=A0A0V1FKW0_TRIPS|nr:hypothetical protein T4D_1254 [Trichinella pseudospiralis]